MTMHSINRNQMHALGIEHYPGLIWRCLRETYTIPIEWPEYKWYLPSAMHGDCLDHAMTYKAWHGHWGRSACGVVIDEDARHAYCVRVQQGMPGAGLLLILYEPFWGKTVRVGDETPDGKYRYSMGSGMVLI